MLGLKYIMLQTALDDDFFVWGGILLIRAGLLPDRIMEIIAKFLKER